MDCTVKIWKWEWGWTYNYLSILIYHIYVLNNHKLLDFPCEFWLCALLHIDAQFTRSWLVWLLIRLLFLRNWVTWRQKLAAAIVHARFQSSPRSKLPQISFKFPSMESFKGPLAHFPSLWIHVFFLKDFMCQICNVQWSIIVPTCKSNLNICNMIILVSIWIDSVTLWVSNLASSHTKIGSLALWVLGIGYWVTWI